MRVVVQVTLEIDEQDQPPLSDDDFWGKAKEESRRALAFALEQNFDGNSLPLFIDPVFCEVVSVKLLDTAK
jgi:hypothetical protein